MLKKEGVIAPYKPEHWDETPAGLKDPDGYWFTIHSGARPLEAVVIARLAQ